MKPARVDMPIGVKFGSLTVVRYDRYEREQAFWVFRCDCGNEKSIAARNVRCGAVVSCGCVRRANAAAATVTHGMTNTRTYKAWRNMHSRCLPHSEHRHRYSDRGISVCQRWSAFEQFLEDMGLAPPRMTLDRIDNDAGYSPGNCRWASQSQQMLNCSRTAYVVFEGQRVPLADLSAAHGVQREMVAKRLRRGWPLERALLTPSLKGGQ